ncbi:MAG: T9SS type A sorting domain-containing protein [Bacteroidetes bacterium]|nr:T9SS type A sorting domain-containing protein [Bacteroidota bacterium]
MEKKLLLLLSVLSLSSYAQIPNYIPTNGLVAYYPFNGNANDESANNNNGIVNGASLTSDRFSNPNSAYSFYSSNDFIEIPTTGGQFNSQQYTISYWFKSNQSASSGSGGPNINPAIISRLNVGGPSANQPTHVNNFCVYEIVGSNTFNTPANGVATLSNTTLGNVWNHIVFVVNADSTISYLNGIKIGANLNVGSVTFQPYPIRLGRSQHTYWKDFSGELDDVGFWNRALTANEINNIYTGISLACTTPDIASNLIAQYDFLGNANDLSGNGNNGVVNGATLTNDRFGNPNSAYHFNGAGNIALSSIQFNSYLNSGFTVSYWYTMEDSTIGGAAGTHFMLTNYDGVNGVQLAYYSSNTGDNTFRHSIRTSTASTPEINFNLVIHQNYNSWRHAVYVWNPPALQTYINGVFIDSQSNSGINDLSVCCSIVTMLGSNWNNASNHSGKLDDIRIYGRALSECDIDSLYNLTSNPIGIKSNETEKSSVKFYPNPTTGKITLDGIQNAEVKIFNQLGQLVLLKTIINGQIDVFELESGVYFLELNHQGIPSRCKILKE